ncbi:TPA: hypothetical protein ACLAJP_000234 [Neisseria meningitidis]
MSIDKYLTEARPDFDDAVSRLLESHPNYFETPDYWLCILHNGKPYRSIAFDHDYHFEILDIFYDIGLRDIGWRGDGKEVKGYALAFDLIANT